MEVLYTPKIINWEIVEQLVKVIKAHGGEVTRASILNPLGNSFYYGEFGFIEELLAIFPLNGKKDLYLTIYLSMNDRSRTLYATYQFGDVYCYRMDIVRASNNYASALDVYITSGLNYTKGLKRREVRTSQEEIQDD